MLHWLPHTRRAERPVHRRKNPKKKFANYWTKPKTDIFGQIKLWEKGNMVSNDKLYIQLLSNSTLEGERPPVSLLTGEKGGGSVCR